MSQLLIKAIIVAILIITVQSLEPLRRGRETVRERDLRSRLLSIARRDANVENLQKAKSLYKKLTKGMGPKEIKKWLRQDPAEADAENAEKEQPLDEDKQGDDNTVTDQQATLIEKELKNALQYKKSALLDRPYVEKMGKNDFLVLRPEVVDPFVTVIPNAIYYNIEKKCVNWLDDCSLKGIRARLLRGAQSPFK